MYCLRYAGFKGNNRADRLDEKVAITSGLHFSLALCVEGLETLPAGTQPRTSDQRSPGGKCCGKGKFSTIFLERTIISLMNTGTVGTYIYIYMGHTRVQWVQKERLAKKTHRMFWYCLKRGVKDSSFEGMGGLNVTDVRRKENPIASENIKRKK